MCVGIVTNVHAHERCARRLEVRHVVAHGILPAHLIIELNEQLALHWQNPLGEEELSYLREQQLTLVVFEQSLMLVAFNRREKRVSEQR